MDVQPRLTSDQPFPGPEPYRERDRHFFRGRRPEAERLERLIARNPLTVLFGSSGLGKSSLLMAGLFPPLREQGYFPILIRLKLGDSSSSGEEMMVADLSAQVMAAVRAAAQAGALEPEGAQDAPSLWEYFHRLELWNREANLLTPVIVLDQFEEVFTLGDRTADSRKAVAAFFEALGEVAENRRPASFDARNGNSAYLDRPPAVRIVLSLRQEYLPHLESYRRLIPATGQSSTRLWLLPFSGSAGQQVLLESAGNLVDAEVAEAIVRAVAARRVSWARSNGRISAPRPPVTDRSLDELSVEPSLLNLFCYQLNERRRRAGKSTIEADLVSSAGDDILSDFYRASLAGLGEPVQRFIEDHLLSETGHRQPIPEEDARKHRGIDEKVLKTLEERRLLRREIRYDTTYVELVHDVLAGTILTARQRRRQARKWRRVLIASPLVAALVAVPIVAVGWSKEVKQAVVHASRSYQMEAAKAAAEEKHAAAEEARARDAQKRADAEAKKAERFKAAAVQAIVDAEAAREREEAAARALVRGKQELREAKETLAKMQDELKRLDNEIDIRKRAASTDKRFE